MALAKTKCHSSVRPERATARKSLTCVGFVEDGLDVSDRGNLAFPGSVRVYIIKPLVWDSSTGALTSF